MGIEIRSGAEVDVEDIFRADGRAFGFTYAADEMAERTPSLEFDRFRVAVDGSAVVGVSGAYSFDLTLPGGAAVPVAGVTWVGVQVTHRRQGLMTRMLAALHDDAAARGEPAAVLTASESGIYGRLGYGVASHQRAAAITKHQAQLRAGVACAGGVRYVDAPDELVRLIPRLYDRYRQRTPGEVSRSPVIWDLLFALRRKASEGLSPAFWLVHRDGYLCYRVDQQWNNGHPAHRLEAVELVALTDDARGALWATLLSLDLAGEITTRFVPLDDPLLHWLDQPRAVRTTSYNDWMWVKPLDPAALLGARRYGAAERLVVQVGDHRFAVDATDSEGLAAGNGAAASVSRVRTRPDLTTDDAGLGAVLLGGVTPSTLVRGGRARAASDLARRRADAMFALDRLPFSQTPF
jgi:predicted acetyltransferase